MRPRFEVIVPDHPEKVLTRIREELEGAKCPCEGKIVGKHCHLRIGDAYFMVSDAFPEWDVKSPADLGGSPVSIMLKVDDCDAATKRAVDAGATLEMPPTDQFWGNRDSRIV